ncbi:hypothetical protein ACFELC_23750 [Pseudomonas aeruginosa]|uniref:hypothetical protein n=1 Tax=Pseudomonas aeruginosa TaxID=287 RepID=UPI00383B5375
MALTNEQIGELERFEPGKAVADALSELLERDAYLLEVDANERTIAYRFAFYLQARLKNWTVDCEYNRDGVDPKKLGLEFPPFSEDGEARTVFPDVIVHHRGIRENYLVIEFKKSTSSVDRSIDRRKLEGYKGQLGYQFALFIEVGTGGQANVARLEWA